MAIDGFSVNLGKPAQGADLKTMVDKKAVSDLIAQAKTDQRFAAATDKYEFRLRETKAGAVLELRRPTTGFFAKIWGGGRRSAERTAAYEALRAQLPGIKERGADAGALRKTEARTLAAEAINLQALDAAVSSKQVFSRIAPSDGDISDAIKSVQSFGLRDGVSQQSGVAGFEVRTQTMSLLGRADISIDGLGRLRITTPGSAGDASVRLETIIAHVAKETELDRGSPAFKTLVENLLTTIRSGCDRQAASLVEAEVGSRYGTAALSGTPERLELSFRVFPSSIRVNVAVTAPMTLGHVANPVAKENYKALLEYRLHVDDLTKPVAEFDAGDAAHDIRFACGNAGDDIGKSADDLFDDSLRDDAAKRSAAKPSEPEFRMNYAPGTVTSHQRVKKDQ